MNNCPSRFATNKMALTRGFVVEEKWKYVLNYQQETVKEFLELIAASGFDNAEELNRKHIHLNVGNEVKTYEEIYPSGSSNSSS